MFANKATVGLWIYRLVMGVLMGLLMFQNYILFQSMSNVYMDLAGRTAGIRFEVLDFRAEAIGKVEGMTGAVEMVRRDNAAQEAYTQDQIKSVKGSLEAQRKLIVHIRDMEVASMDVITGFKTDIRLIKDGLKKVVPGEPKVETDRESYYHALYDFCVYALIERGATQSQAQEGCLDTTKELYKQNWHERDSDGWKWPFAIGGIQG
jgi:hypothetical protein